MSSAARDEQQLIVQAYRHLVRFDLTRLPEVTPGSVLSQNLTPPFVVPYSGFDQLTSWPDESCGAEAIGIGVFDPPARYTRRLQCIVITTNDYSVVDVNDSMSYSAFALAHSTSEGELLFAIGRRVDRHIASIWQRRACGAFTKLAEREIDFDWRAAPLVINGREVPSQHSDGVRILAHWDELNRVLTGLHYDGYTVRVFTANADNNWSIVARTHVVHETRSDYSFVVN